MEVRKVNNDLPEGWMWTTLDKACLIIQGQSPKSITYNDEGKGVPFFQGKAEFGELYPSPVKWCTSPKKKALKGDILISVRAPVGPTNIATFECCIGRGLAALRSRDGIDSKYILYNLRSQINEIANMGTGSTFTAINGAQLKGIEILLAPFPIQTLIVSEIEKQFSRLDEAVAALKRVRAGLKRYKASVLKAAVEGKLTEEWRKQNPNVEPADKLLKRILVERKKKWEDSNPKKKYKEPSVPDTSNLPELPEGWAWSNLEQLAEASSNALKAGPFGSSLKKSYYVPKGYKIYGQEQVLRDDPYFGDYYINEKRYKMLESCAVKPGDILISLVGTIGRVLILPDKIEPGIINPRLVKGSLDRRLINAKFIKGYLQSPYVKHLFSLASHGGTMDILNLTILKEVPIPLPPRAEQNNIIEEIERHFSVDDEIEAAVETNLNRAERLRQAILKKAFSGRLITQKE